MLDFDDQNIYIDTMKFHDDSHAVTSTGRTFYWQIGGVEGGPPLGCPGTQGPTA